MDTLRGEAGPLQLVTGAKASRAGFRLLHQLLLKAADEEEDCYRIGRVGLREIGFDKAELETEFWVDDVPHAAVQINEPTNPATENGLSAIARDASGKRFLLRQAWLKKNKASEAVRDEVFARLTALPIAQVRLDRSAAKRQWHVVTPLDEATPDVVALAVEDFVERCWKARCVVAGVAPDGEDISGLDDDDREGVARLLARTTLPEVKSAIRYLVETALASSFRLVFRKSDAVAGVEFQDGTRSNLYSLIANPRHLLFYLRGPAQECAPRLHALATARYGAQKPNKRGEYRVRVTSLMEAEQLVAWLREVDAWDRIINGPRGRTREPAATFGAVTAAHILVAARLVADGADHPFGQSTDYDLLFDGMRLPPKAVFGLAATAALGRAIGPYDFSGGRGTPCFRILADAGYVIVGKDEPEPADPDLSADDRSWTEGDRKLMTHLRRERGTGLSSAKRAHFIGLHGKLFCERCEMDPVAHFGGRHGEACIEVHHHRIAVAEMAPGHRTELEDLQCLCANCHRVVHRELKLRGGLN